MKTQSICPACGEVGAAVDNATLKALLSVSLHHVHDITHRFCKTADCDIVYYSEDGARSFTTSDVRERVYQKVPDNDDVLICYCFFHTVASVHQDIKATEGRTILADIHRGIEGGHCACDWRNPQGTCCLGNVQRLIKQEQAGQRET